MAGRDLKVYLQQIKNINQVVSAPMISQCQKDIQSLQKQIKQKIKNDIKLQIISKQVVQWHKNNLSKLKTLKDYSEQSTDQFLLEVMLNIVLGIYVTFNKKIPRTTQLICFWINIHSNHTILEVKTGQGKTMIVAMTALYYALRGKKVDVFTSSATLATTEASVRENSSVRQFYTLFGISLNENCSIRLSQSESALVYQSQIIYGTSFQFQADYLKKVFSGKIQFFKDREFDDNHVAILDEVDALLIDKMKDSTRLSSQKPLYESIKTLFVLIYEVKTKLMRARECFGGQLKVKILDKQVTFDNLQSSNIKNQTQEEFKTNQLEQIHKILTYALQNDLKNLFPNYLLEKSGYISHMLRTWVKNSFQSQRYEQDVQYIVTKDRKIVPIDISTGTYQKNTKWSDGIHQFVELRHGIQPSVDSLVTNYQSNLIFFQRYKKYMFGMTGTIAKSIGNAEELAKKSVFQLFLQKAYKLKIYKIPTFKKRLLSTQHPKLMLNQFQWMKVIVQHAQQYSKNRMVLLIFQTIKQAKTFISQFKQQTKKDSSFKIVELFDHDQYQQTMQNKMDKQKTIIVSTNLGGRGTDFQINNENILKNGGLFVMMTYFAQNWRIQQQAFGRAGRNGQPGSGAFYINVQKFSSGNLISMYKNKDQCIKNFKILEDARGKVQLQNFKKSENSIKIEMQKVDLLQEFKEKYVTPNLQRLRYLNQEIQKNGRIIQKCSQTLIQYYTLQMQINLAQQQWGLFLKQRIGQNPEEQINISFKQFVQYYQNNKKTDDINPGIMTYTGSRILDIEKHVTTLNNKCQSYSLFSRAISKNKEWISKYYLTFFKLKSYQGNIVSNSFYQQLNSDLRQIANLMIVNLSTHMAMQNHFQERQDRDSTLNQAQRKSKQQLLEIQQFFITEITKLQSIAKTLQLYSIKQGKNMLFECQLETSTHSLSRLLTLGFDKVFVVKIFEKPPPKKKPKRGFWGSLWDGICSVVKTIVLTAVSVVATAFAAVATPIMCAFGGRQKAGELWSGVGKLWKKTGEQVNKVLTNPAFHYLAGVFGVFLASGSPIAAAAWAGISYWIFFGGFQTIDSAKVEVDHIQDKAAKKSLIDIRGEFELSQQASKQIKKMYESLKIKKKIINQELKKKLELVDEIRAMNNSFKKSQMNLKLKVQAYSTKKDVFDKSKEQLDEIIKTQPQINKKAQQLIGKIIEANKFNQKINAHQQNLIQKKKANLTSTQTELNKGLQNIVNAVNTKIQTESAQLNSLKPKTNEQVQQINKKVQQFNAKVTQINTTLPAAQQVIQAQVQKSIAQSRVFSAANVANNIDLALISKQQIKVNLHNLQSPVKDYVQTEIEHKQILDVWKKQVIIQKALDVNVSTLKGQFLKNITSDIQDSAYDEIKNQLIQKANKTEEQIKKQVQIQQEGMIVNVLNKMKSDVKNACNTPIHTPSQINDFLYYSRIIRDQAIHSKLNVVEQRNTQKVNQILIDLFKNTHQQEKIHVFKGVVIYQVGKNVVCKIYQKNQESANIAKQLDKKCEVIYEQKNLSSPGWSMVTDVKKFIHNISDQQCLLKNFGIDKSSKDFDVELIKKQYMASMIMEATSIILGEKYPKILQDRKNKGKGSLPQTFLPFQLDLNSQQFKQAEYDIQNLIMDELFKKDMDFHKYKYLTTALMDKMISDQKQTIKQIYEDYAKFLPSQKKTKKVR